jgi:hypothetical protein
MKHEFDQFTGFQWDKGNINKNLDKHNVENWECEQFFFNEPLIILDDQKHSFSEKRVQQQNARELLPLRFFKIGGAATVWVNEGLLAKCF